MAKKRKPQPPSKALMSMLPPDVRESFHKLEEERYDDNVTPEQWERHSMVLMRKAATLPPAIRDAFGRAIKQVAAVEKHEAKQVKQVDKN